jgi:hypothetical protein
VIRHAHKSNRASIQVILKIRDEPNMSENLQGDFSQSVQLIKLGLKYFAKQQEQLIAQQKREYRKQMCAEIMQAKTTPAMAMGFCQRAVTMEEFLTTRRYPSTTN